MVYLPCIVADRSFIINVLAPLYVVNVTYILPYMYCIVPAEQIIDVSYDNCDYVIGN